MCQPGSGSHVGRRSKAPCRPSRRLDALRKATPLPVETLLATWTLVANSGALGSDHVEQGHAEDHSESQGYIVPLWIVSTEPPMRNVARCGCGLCAVGCAFPGDHFNSASGGGVLTNQRPDRTEAVAKYTVQGLDEA